MKNTAIETFCDRGIVFSCCVSIFVLPAAIAYLDSFIGLAIFFYFVKKISRIVSDWPERTSHLNPLGKILSVWKGFAPPVNILNRPLQFLTLAVFISVLFSQYPKLSVLAFFGKYIKCVFLYFSFIEAFKDKKRIWIFIYFFLVSAFITALTGIIQHFHGQDFLKGHVMAGGRINSFFYTANGLGAYLLPVIALVTNLLFAAVVKNKSWVWAGVLAVLLAVLSTCLCWTYSRSAWVGYLVILFVMCMMDRRKVLFAGAILLVFIFIFLPSLTNVRHMYLINDNNRTTVQSGGAVQSEKSFSGQSVLEQGGSGRLNFWKKAIEIIRFSPIYGTGLNTYSRILRRNPDTTTWWYAHNCYLQMAAETGVVGLLCFLWLLFALLRYGLDHCKQINDGEILTLLQGVVSGLFGFLVQSFFDNTFYTVQLGVLMWLMIGLTVAVARLNFSAIKN